MKPKLLEEQCKVIESKMHNHEQKSEECFDAINRGRITPMMLKDWVSSGLEYMEAVKEYVAITNMLRKNLEERVESN